MRRLVLALATAAPLLALSSAPASAWGWDRGYYGYSYAPYCPPYRSYYYTYRPSYGYAPYYGAYWRPRFYSGGYFYRPYRPWGWYGYRSWGWGHRPYRAWGAGWGYRGWGWRHGGWGGGWGHRGWGGGWRHGGWRR
jgi:hypothetical protein